MNVLIVIGSLDVGGCERQLFEVLPRLARRGIKPSIYVLSGKGMLQVDGKDQAVKAGSLLFVAKNANHRFHSITSELSLLVFFAPEEGANQQSEPD